jgi:squalene-hopene/tetraprenyl-beta-curcumene cyclase
VSRPAWALVLLAAASAPAQDAPGKNRADEPLAPAASLDRAASFLDGVALDWTRKRSCGACHTNYVYLWARPGLRKDGAPAPAMDEIRAFFEKRAAGWDAAKPRWDTEVVATAVTLAVHDAATTRKLHPVTRAALDRMWTLQKPHGAWDWLKCNWPPMEHDDYFGAVYAAFGVGSAPDAYATSDSARAGVEKLRGYLASTPPPDLHHRTMLLWASTRLPGLLDADGRAGAVAALLAAQRADGGWALPGMADWKRHDGSPNPKDGPSDGYATGLALIALREAGLPAASRSAAGPPGSAGTSARPAAGSPARRAPTSATS